MRNDAALLVPALPVGGAQLCPQLLHRIPKIAVGNPGEQRELAWDIIPNWRSWCTEDPVVAARARLPDDIARLLERCHGRTVWELLDHSTPARTGETLTDVFDLLKAARSLGLVEWDFTVRSDDGAWLRRRRLGHGPDRWKWFYLPPYTKHVLDQCSGARSCEQIGARISSLTSNGKGGGVDCVVQACVALVRIGVVDWIDDIHHRERRRRAFISRPAPTVRT